MSTPLEELKPTTGSDQLFRCVRCGTVDMVDLAESMTRDLSTTYAPFHCSMCLTGNWHYQFAQKQYDPKTDDVINPPQPPSCS
jgi:hypothetical protein